MLGRMLPIMLAYFDAEAHVGRGGEPPLLLRRGLPRRVVASVRHIPIMALNP